MPIAISRFRGSFLRSDLSDSALLQQGIAATGDQGTPAFRPLSLKPGASTEVSAAAASAPIVTTDATLTGDASDNTLSGTADADTFQVNQGGNDTLSGLAGGDLFYFGGALTAADNV